MTTDRINQLDEQIKSLITKGLVYHQDISKPLHRAKVILELLVQIDFDEITKNTRHDVLMMTEEFVAESVALNTEHLTYLRSINFPGFELKAY